MEPVSAHETISHGVCEHRAGRMNRVPLLCVVTVIVACSTLPLLASEWLPPAPLNTNAETDDGNDFLPVLRRSAGGMVVAMWASQSTLDGTIGTDDDILFARSTDDGMSWSDPEPLNTTAASDDAIEDIAGDLATDGKGSWMAVWRSPNDLDQGLGVDQDILFAVSVDDGVTWSAPAVVNSDADFDQFLLWGGHDNGPSVATGGAGSWMVTWHKRAIPDGDWDILFATSTDLGQTWSDPGHVNNFGLSDGAPIIDEHSTVVSHGDSAYMVMWLSRNPFDGGYGGDQDIFVARTTNNGASWSDPQPVNSNAGQDGADESSPLIGGNGDGTWMIIWSAQYPDFGSGTDYDVFYSVSVNDGLTWSDIRALNTTAVWDNDHVTANNDYAGSIAGNSSGTWIGVWESNEELQDECSDGGIGSDPDILYAVSTDEGATWTYPMPVNSYAADDASSDSDEEPRVLPTGDFHWLAVWRSVYTLGDTTGPDQDLFLSRTTIPDEDEDGVPDVADNCLHVGNADQLDADEDGVGDACDVCPAAGAVGGVDSDGAPGGDIDHDCDVDLVDFGMFQSTFTGPGS